MTILSVMNYLEIFTQLTFQKDVLLTQQNNKQMSISDKSYKKNLPPQATVMI